MTAPWHTYRETADLLERLNQLAGDAPLGDLSKDTAQAVTRGRQATAAFVAVLRQAARETGAAIRLQQGLAAMDPDKRREHILDDYRDALGETWDRREAEAEGWR